MKFSTKLLASAAAFIMPGAVLGQNPLGLDHLTMDSTSCDPMGKICAAYYSAPLVNDTHSGVHAIAFFKDNDKSRSPSTGDELTSIEAAITHGFCNQNGKYEINSLAIALNGENELTIDRFQQVPEDEKLATRIHVVHTDSNPKMIHTQFRKYIKEAVENGTKLSIEKADEDQNFAIYLKAANNPNSRPGF